MGRQGDQIEESKQDGREDEDSFLFCNDVNEFQAGDLAIVMKDLKVNNERAQLNKMREFIKKDQKPERVFKQSRN